MDTIFALSSGAPPAALAIVRVSGPGAARALQRLCGHLPEPRRATLTDFSRADGSLLDRGIALWFPGPRSATGEDSGELHLHGGRAVVGAVLAELATFEGLRAAEAGEFTRRAFASGRLDLLEVEGLADLLAAETEVQRQAALGLAGGGLSHEVEGWRTRLITLSARVEAVLDFEDEDDVSGLDSGFYADLNRLADDLAGALDAPRAETVREGFRVALGGPPNAGKSTLFNALLEDDAAIVTPVAGTTRDVLVRQFAIEGVPFTLVDMAGLRGSTDDQIEIEGIERARGELERADLVLWLGSEGECPVPAWEIETQIDRAERASKSAPDHRVSAVTGEGLGALIAALSETARHAMVKPGRAALAQRQRAALQEAREELEAAGLRTHDALIVGEHLRRARTAFDRLVGRTATEDLLDALFGRFCIGK